MIKRNFKTAQSNQVWTSDLTYISTQEEWLYLAVILDLYSRKIVGWPMDSNIGTQLVSRALNQAVKQRKPKPRLIYHSDRGSQYASYEYQRALKKCYEMLYEYKKIAMIMRWLKVFFTH